MIVCAVPLMGILGLPNLPVDFPAQPACQSVAAVCKSVLNLAHEPQVNISQNPEGEFLVGFEGLESTLRKGLAVGRPWSQNH